MANDTSSPYGPSIRTGRGGAGNFIWQSDLEKKRAEDPESALPSKLTTNTSLITKSSHPIPSSSTTTTTTTTQPYIPTGRGGSGNFHPPPLSPTLPTTTSTPSKPSPNPSRISGRGGAGNIEATNAAASQARNRVEEKEREELEEQVRRAVRLNVEQGLERPRGAWIEVPEGRERE